MNAPPIDQLYATHEPAVRRSVAMLLREPHDVDDVVQDTFLRAHVALRERPVPEDRIRPWLLTVARNRALDVLRARRPVEELGERPGATGLEPALVHERREALQATVGAVLQLPQAQRRALVRHAVDGERYAVVARELHVSSDAAKALAWRGRAEVRRRLAAAA